jgi:cellulose synthase/poly-beta-1,6-N-acetylglucosamine synthase-like glycosyltransferase
MAWTDMTMIALLSLLAYIYFGYPLLLCLLAHLFPRPHRTDEEHLPTVTLVISAYNEADVIRAKIENSLSLDYPKQSLSIVVVSDCSSDGTDAEVLAFAGRDVRLVRASERRGKTAALNLALAGVTSEIVVFSDANAIYDRSAIRNLVRHFADPIIGYAVGHARYEEEAVSAAGGSEGAYWNLEVQLKRWESRFSSVVGGDGAIYAIRRNLYQPMLETDINDFVNPLQIVAKGYRGVFDDQAWCVERPAGQFGKEFARKVRIVNRSFNGYLRVPQACNPLRTGRFAWQLVSHKLLRWFSPYILCLLLAVLCLDRVLEPVRLLDQISLVICAVVAGLALTGWLLNRGSRAPTLLCLPYYFVLMNLASALGVFQRLRGRTTTTWTTVRESEAAANSLPLAPRLMLFFGAAVLLLASCGLTQSVLPLGVTATILVLALAHTFMGYPYLLIPLGRFLGKPLVRDEQYLPSVTLLVVAFNEAQVIEEKLRNCLALDYPRERLRIMVASDGSGDGTDQIVMRYREQGIELVSFPVNRGKIAALNEAMQGIDSEIVVLSDANVSYSALAVGKLVRNFADPRVGAVSGKVVLKSDTLSYGAAEKSYYGIEHRIQEREGSVGALIGADGAMYAIRRSLFIPPSGDTILDDLVIAMGIARHGHLVVHEKEALGFEDNLLELKGEFRRKVRIIAGGYQCLLRASVLPRLSQPLLLFCFVSHKVLRWVSGFLLLALLGVLAQIQLRSGTAFFGALLAGLVGGMLVALLVQMFPALKGYKPANLCHYFFMLMAASLVGCYLGMTGRQKVTWRGGAA